MIDIVIWLTTYAFLYFYDCCWSKCGGAVFVCIGIGILLFAHANIYDRILICLWLTQLQRVPSIIASRKEFSTASPLNASPKPGPTGKPPESKGNFSKVVVGTAVVVAGAGLLAYQNGYLDQYIGKEKEKHDSLDSIELSEGKKDVKDDQHLLEPTVSSHSDEEPKTSSPVTEQAVQSVETDKDFPQPKTLSKMPVEDQARLQDKAELTSEDLEIPVKENDTAENSNKSVASDEQSMSPPISSEGSVEMESSEPKTREKSDDEVQGTEIHSQASVVPEEKEQKTLREEHIVTEEKSEVPMAFTI